MLQHHARKYNIPVDTLSFSFEVLNKEPHELTEPPEEGAYVSTFNVLSSAFFDVYEDIRFVYGWRSMV